MDYAENILNEIIYKRCYWYGPAHWSIENDNALKELEEAGLIISLDKKLGRDTRGNNCYIYVEKEVEHITITAQSGGGKCWH